MAEERTYTEPTDEQLENFVRVVIGPFAPLLIAGNPELKKGALRLHRHYQEKAWEAADKSG